MEMGWRIPIKTIDRILSLIKQIPDQKQPALLAMVENFRRNNGWEQEAKDAPSAKAKWERFAGALSDEDAERMKRAIEQDCD